ncbi:CHAT domain-containing protein [Planktothrix pseudagardhii]|uniref:Filamentous hemagglutinin family outer membrane protein n=1 Tax=Planktothrix pseudagardhii TaxID=132604 RepID=A0A9W4GA98_9CYAN|nr:CHAT domain-containing protein [Planktothrix pseudagardhii]CAD5985338.1 Filamentous hemagglutinin family outer membrane protein [Planktothrix pseudagardhii]
MKIQQSLSLFGLISASVIVSPLVHAQPIIPANDGTETQIIPHNNQWNIQGGQRSSDGSNLFHSFQNFNVNTGQIVNFISEPNIQNILGRVTGGQASIIDGLIQVIGGNSNLFLINPAGIVFGSNASLNIPAAFTVTTADAIGFGQGNWFNSIGNNNWSTLVGTPSEFQFNSPQPGAIINLGELNINSGQSLRLLGGTVINEGSLNAPSGELYVQTVPGQSLVKISQIGHALSLEITPNLTANSASINPLSLPELLTGSGLNSATQTTLNQAGEVVLSNGLSVNSGDVIMTSGATVNAQTANLQATNNLILAENQLSTTGDLNLIATNTVTIRDGQIPFQANAGGNLTIQGNQNIDILALKYPITPLQSQENMTLISDGIISGDAHFFSGGNFSILNLRGTGGNFVTLYDPIISSEADVIFGDYTGSSLKIESKGAISGGNINITTPDTSLTNITDPDAEILRNSPALILKSGVQILANPVNLAPDSEFRTVEDQIISSQSNLFSGNNLISVGEVITSGGPVLLESASEIFVDSILPLNETTNIAAVDAGIEGLETEINNSFESGNFEQAVSGLENLISFEYSNYFGTNFNSPETPSSQISQVLSSLDQQTNTKSALIYVYSRENELEIVLVRSNGSILHRNVPGVNQKILVDLIKEFRLEISSSRKNKQGAYLEKAQQLYQWIIAPIEAELKQENIEILMFTMDAILRGIPLAALHDGKQFLVEKYALSLIPSFNLVNTQYRSTAQATVLAMGASQFQDQNPLPAVPVELSTVTSELNTNQYFLNQDFTLINLKNQYKTNPTPIIHLATHADFKPGDASNSYIHLWDQKLPLNQLSQLGLSDPTVDLLVLSACRTAVGDKNAELGFAGLAVASGAKSVLASLWYVSDEGTLGLMSEFYHHLDTMGIKAKALQAAQIAMIRGQVRIEEGRLILVNQNQEITLPPDLKNLNNDELNYPYYWAAFTLVGSPW